LESLGQTKIKLVGFDLIEPNLKYLRSEGIDFLINQNPVKQGYLGIINIVNYLVLKKEIKATHYLPLDVVMKENAAYYLEPDKQLHLFF
ncbi:MAG: LacI family transcriptional regulator, partial [Bacteroidota bacterium]